MYGYEVRALNQQVKRNAGRFPDDFMGILAFCLEYGIGTKKDDKDEMQEKQDDSSMTH